jgi:type IV pilus assembly protein PilA
MRRIHIARAGFTLIELMIVVGILGILAAVAIPGFALYMRRAKTVEATENVSKMFDAAASYYTRERAGSGITAGSITYCYPIDGVDSMATPGQNKQSSTYSAGFNVPTGIGFTASGPHYYKYSMTGAAAGCGNLAGSTGHTLGATGDLDGDGTLSSFALATASNPENDLYHATGFYIINDAE